MAPFNVEGEGESEGGPERSLIEEGEEGEGEAEGEGEGEGEGGEEGGGKGGE